MTERKLTKKYYFTVEGETEQWYLKWLQGLINHTEEADLKVSIDCSVCKNPLKWAKSLAVIGPTVIYHLFDYESNEKIYADRFQNAMDNMYRAQKIGKQIKYRSGYSNFTFDLWIILHMMDCNFSYTHRRQYIDPINKAFDEHFENPSLSI